MKKRAFACISFLILIVCISVWLKLYLLAILSILIILIFIGCFLLSDKPIAKKWRKAPDLLEDLRRNYTYIKLGYRDVCDEGLDLTQERSNLFSDFLVLKRYYSLLDKGGCVIINARSTKRYMFCSKPSLFSLCMLHPVTMLELGYHYYSYEVKWNELLNPILYYLTGWLNKSCSKRKYYNEELIDEIEQFCVERNLKIIWYIDGAIKS